MTRIAVNNINCSNNEQAEGGWSEEIRSQLDRFCFAKQCTLFNLCHPSNSRGIEAAIDKFSKQDFHHITTYKPKKAEDYECRLIDFSAGICAIF